MGDGRPGPGGVRSPAQVWRAVLRSMSCHSATAWLTAKPSYPAYVLGGPAFHASVRRRLQVPWLPLAGPWFDCVCGLPTVQIGPNHALNCPKVWGLARCTLHAAR